LRATGTSGDITETYIKKTHESSGIAECVYCAESTLEGDESWILI
jgi:hypothetical protein